MNYCKTCSKIFPQGTCPTCGKVAREVQNDDFILVGKFNLLKASLIEPILKDNNIPYLRKAKQGSGFVANAGGLLEEISIFITRQEYDRAMEVIFPFIEERESDIPNTMETAEEP